MGAIHQAVRYSQTYRPKSSVDQLAALPGPVHHVSKPVFDLFDTFDENQPVRIYFVNHVCTLFGCHGPISLRVATTPGAVPGWLVVEVGADYRVVAKIALSQGTPLIDPLVLSELYGIPEIRLTISRRTMLIEDDFELPLTSFDDNLVHDLEPVQALEIRVLTEVNPVRREIGIEQFIRKRQPNAVETRLSDLIKHTQVASCPDSMGCQVICLKTKPVQTGESNLLTGLIANQSTIRM